MRLRFLALALVAVTSAPSQAATLERLAIGCRTTSSLDAVLTAFQSGDGPERLNGLVRSRDCQWLDAGTTYTLSPAAPTDVARQIKTSDGSTYWVLKQFVSIAGSVDASRPTMDNETFLALATMKAIFIFAEANCAGRPSSTAAKAMELATASNPAKMQFALDQIGTSIRQQSEKRGAREQCKTIVEAYGLRGTVQAGAWVPTER